MAYSLKKRWKDGTSHVVMTKQVLMERLCALVPRLCAYDAEVCAAVRGILVRAVSSFYERRARQQGRSRPRAGAVAFVQRFDSALRVNLHFHVLWTDGVFAHQLRGGRVEFCEHDALADADVTQLIERYPLPPAYVVHSAYRPAASRDSRSRMR